MPTSRSSKPGVRPPPPARRARILWPLILIIVATVLTVGVVALPASMLARFLPPPVRADDFSGSVWHGSAGRITVNGHDAGAIEWRVHPMALLQMRVAADLHWVKVGMVIDGAAEADRHEISAHDIEGGGPVEDLRDLGVAPGWRGTAIVKIKELKAVYDAAGVNLKSAVGDVQVLNLSCAQIAGGADLGGYALHFTDGAITPDADASAEISDIGGPLQIQAVIQYAAKERRGMLSGTIKERTGAGEALHAEVDSLTQLHARDAEGRIPFDLEFTF